MPNFHEVYLGDLCTFTQGVQIADKDTLKTLQQGYIRYIYIRDLFTDKYPVYVKDKYPKKLLYQGDIVMVNTGNTSGSVYQAKEGVLCNNAFKISVRETKHKLLDKEFLWVYLNSNAREQMLKRLFNPAGQPHVGHKNVARLKIKLPPLPEQRKIAKILSTWDKAITTTEKLIATSQQQKKALMQQLLTGKKRLLNPETGMLFEGDWELKKLKDLCHINPKKPAKPSDGKVSFIPMTNISEDGHVIQLEDKLYDDVSKGFTSFIDNDVIIAKITPCFENGKGAFISGLNNGIGFGSTEYHVLRAKKKTHSKFIYYITRTSELLTKGAMNMQGSAGHRRVTADYFNAYKINTPPYDEQQKIASVLTTADKEIELLLTKLVHFKQEKKALMQQLLTGKKRVSLSS